MINHAACLLLNKDARTWSDPTGELPLDQFFTPIDHPVTQTVRAQLFPETRDWPTALRAGAYLRLLDLLPETYSWVRSLDRRETYTRPLLAADGSQLQADAGLQIVWQTPPDISDVVVEVQQFATGASDWLTYDGQAVPDLPAVTDNICTVSVGGGSLFVVQDNSTPRSGILRYWTRPEIGPTVAQAVSQGIFSSFLPTSTVASLYSDLAPSRIPERFACGLCAMLQTLEAGLS